MSPGLMGRMVPRPAYCGKASRKLVVAWKSILLPLTVWFSCKLYCRLDRTWEFSVFFLRILSTIGCYWLLFY